MELQKSKVLDHKSEDLWMKDLGVFILEKLRHKGTSTMTQNVKIGPFSQVRSDSPRKPMVLSCSAQNH